uniref:NHR domain-containing protein n=1 Tax=Sinocyclocheilus grahami TaxID=75366 RepID=A0A672JYG7_SINGR
RSKIVSPSGLETSQATRFMEFHSVHGTNVKLDPSRTQATRVESFANGIYFSKDPLSPGEIFLVEIEEKELGWCGHLRIGLTAHDPRTLETVPEYSLPDLTDYNDPSLLLLCFSCLNADTLPKDNSETHHSQNGFGLVGTSGVT